MSSVEDLAESVTRETAATVRAVLAYREMKPAALARALGWSDQRLSGYLTGKSALTVPLLHLFARALGVEPWVLLMSKPNAMRWLADNEPGNPDVRSSVPARELDPYHAEQLTLALAA